MVEQRRQRAVEHGADQAHQLRFHDADRAIRGDGGEQSLHQNRFGERRQAAVLEGSLARAASRQATGEEAKLIPLLV